MIFQKLIDERLNSVRACPQAGMLGENVCRNLEKVLRRIVRRITQSTEEKLLSQEVTGSNPVAASWSFLLTKEERQDALRSIQQKLEDGRMTLPATLEEVLSQQLNSVTDAFLEMLARMEAHRDAICAALTGGKLYRRIEDITLSAGDTHNCGRSVTIVHTDAGKLVYKPHDLRGDEWISGLVNRYYPEFVGIPASIAFGDSFGVCEYIEKRRAEGKEEAEQFWYALGGLTAFVKLMGSTDLHIENLLACGTKTYIIDLETIIRPLSAEEESLSRISEKSKSLQNLPASSLLMPFRVKDFELSILMNTDEDSSSPLVDGKPTTVREYLPAYKQGYSDAYTRGLRFRKEIEQEIRAFAPKLPVRIVLRNTRGYADILKKLYHHSALASEEGREQALTLLRELLHSGYPSLNEKIIDSEVRQMSRGDVPYFYTYGDSHSLFSDGEELAGDQYSSSAAERTLETLNAMNEGDKLFDLAYINQAILAYPAKRDPEAVPEKEWAEWTKQPPLSTKTAADEALRILRQVYSLRIPLPDGKLLWGFVHQGSYSMGFSDYDLFNGVTGLAVFACACAYALENEEARDIAEIMINEAAEDIRVLCAGLRGSLNPERQAPLGEGGLGGVLTVLALLRRYGQAEKADSLTAEVFQTLAEIDIAACRTADRINGAAGLAAALCRFEEYRNRKEIIRAAADRILALKTFKYNDDLLWRTMDDIPRVLSGAGHGMAGIAEALYAAADVLGDSRYLPAAEDALAYEQKAYRRFFARYGTFPDLREFPPVRYMHGYCSGAPGIGILLERMLRNGRGGVNAGKLAAAARQSTDRLPPDVTDVLCCANGALAEYYLSVGDAEAAGRILGAMYARRQREGEYRFSGYQAENSVTASLFYGLSGVGYEMLRYAFPDKIISIL